MLNWKKTDYSKIRQWQVLPLILSVVIGTVVPFFAGESYSIGAAISVALGSWVILLSLSDIGRKTRNAVSFRVGLTRLSASYYGMILAHIGFAVTLMGATLNTIYSVQRDVRLSVGETIEIANMTYELAEVRREKGPNYSADVGEIVVRDLDGNEVVTLEPEKRRYISGGNVMTEAAIDPSFMRDVYVALGSQLNNTDWEVRIHFKPVVRWIWLGAIFMALGGMIAIMDKRYKLLREKYRKKIHDKKASPSIDNTVAQAKVSAGE